MDTDGHVLRIRSHRLSQNKSAVSQSASDRCLLSVRTLEHSFVSVCTIQHISKLPASLASSIPKKHKTLKNETGFSPKQNSSLPVREPKDSAQRHDWAQNLENKISAAERVCHKNFVFKIFELVLLPNGIFLL